MNKVAENLEIVAAITYLGCGIAAITMMTVSFVAGVKENRRLSKELRQQIAELKNN